MARTEGSENQVTHYGANEEPKKCRNCESPHSRVYKKQDTPGKGSAHRKVADKIIVRRARVCKTCGDKWGSLEELTRAAFPGLFE